MDFLRNVFTNFIFEKLFSHEELVTRRVTAISNNLYKQSNAFFKGALNEINCSSDVGSCDSFSSKLFARSISYFKSFSLVQYAFANSLKCSSDRNLWTPLERAEMPESIAPKQARNQIGTLGGAKSFLRGAQIFKIISSSSKLYPTHFPGDEKSFSSQSITKSRYKLLCGCRTCMGRLKLKSRTISLRCFEVIYTKQQNTSLQSG